MYETFRTKNLKWIKGKLSVWGEDNFCKAVTIF